jgi:rare lipoprotein A
MVNQIDTRRRVEKDSRGAGVRLRLVLGLLGLALAGCSSSGGDGPRTTPQGIYKLGQPYQIDGRWYYPEFDPAYDRIGVASWYGAEFDGRPTANGEVFDLGQLSAAHPTMPLPSLVRVTNLDNGRELELRVNDRGPFVGDRIIDLSQAAARELGFEREGIAPVRVQFLRLADEARGTPPAPTVASAPPRTGPTPLVQLAGDSRSVPPASNAPPAPPQTTPMPPVQLVSAPDAICRGRFIQLAAFAEPARAVRLSGRLRPVAPAPVRVERSRADGYTRVWLGPIADAGEADLLLGQLREAGYGRAFFGRPATSVAAC